MTDKQTHPTATAKQHVQGCNGHIRSLDKLSQLLY